ncbi:MAG: TIGR01458 family HAD-type hydrolase [Gammaproteobacteria bacterium]|nr:TIGR01458 family HAD-type hydrolase [Gammaproteobacteria bacterium]
MIKGVLLDLSGVLYVGSQPLPGALDAVQHLVKSGLQVRYITNTTRSPRSAILKKLAAMDLAVARDEVFTAAIASRNYIKRKNLSPYLLVHTNLLPEFSEFDQKHFDSVLLGDAGTGFTYEKLNMAFRLLLDGAPLFAMGNNRYFKEEDGFSLDAGPFVHALESASGVRATVLGKPAKEFFLEAIQEFCCSPGEVVMVGDDVEADINGASTAGLQAILVKTGKYRSSDDQCIFDPSVRIADDISQAVGWIA